MKNRILVATLVVGFALAGFAQSAPAAKPKAPPKKTSTASAAKKKPGQKLDPRKQFVVDVVKSAVALLQSDPQDRLRVLSSAASVMAPINLAFAKTYTREGLRIEQELIQAGETPVASMMESGQVDCAQIGAFVENIPTSRISAAEQSLIGAISLCPKQSVEPAKRKVEAGMEERQVAPRALLSLIEHLGASTQWSQENFARMFSSLPADATSASKEAANYPAMYARMAPVIDKDVARTTGVKLLTWLAKLNQSGDRNLAVNVTTGAMKETLGEKGYKDALASDVMASQIAQTAGQPGEIEHPEEENVSVLQAMGNSKVDRTAELNEMAPSMRAREAAASGFATGTDGNPKMSARYFDIAFSALDKVWDDRNSVKDAPGIVQEVSEAAAQVDAVDALKRAQKLSDRTAQAIGMIAVARVVSAQQTSAMAEQ